MTRKMKNGNIKRKRRVRKSKIRINAIRRLYESSIYSAKFISYYPLVKHT